MMDIGNSMFDNFFIFSILHFKSNIRYLASGMIFVTILTFNCYFIC